MGFSTARNRAGFNEIAEDDMCHQKIIDKWSCLLFFLSEVSECPAKKNLTRNDPSNISPKKMVMLKESQVQTALFENMVPPIPTEYHHHSPH